MWNCLDILLINLHYLFNFRPKPAVMAAMVKAAVAMVAEEAAMVAVMAAVKAMEAAMAVSYSYFNLVISIAIFSQ